MDNGIYPPDRALAASYWLHAAGCPPRLMRWNPKSSEWIGHGASSPQWMQSRGYTLACPYPIPGPDALNRMHAPDKAMVNAALDRGKDLQRTIHEGIFVAMLREAMKEDLP
jgi:hypothetical protein